MVIRRKPRIRETLRLIFIQHAQCNARLHAHIRDTLNHVTNTIKRTPIQNFRPCRTHTKTSRTCFFRFLRLLQNIRRLHQQLFFKFCFIMQTLRTIPAIFCTPTCLNRQQCTHLHFIRCMVCTMYASRLVYQI